MNEPIPLILHCPACGHQHIDRPSGEWMNTPHRSHKCNVCEHIWRPADVATCGVAELKTYGAHDTLPPDAVVRRMTCEEELSMLRKLMWEVQRTVEDALTDNRPSRKTYESVIALIKGV